jgi:hypothetical protein
MVKTIEGRRQGGTQKEVVTELLGCVEHSTSGILKPIFHNFAS